MHFENIREPYIQNKKKNTKYLVRYIAVIKMSPYVTYTYKFRQDEKFSEEEACGILLVLGVSSFSMSFSYIIEPSRTRRPDPQSVPRMGA